MVTTELRNLMAKGQVHITNSKCSIIFQKSRWVWTSVSGHWYNVSAPGPDQTSQPRAETSVDLETGINTRPFEVLP